MALFLECTGSPHYALPVGKAVPPNDHRFEIPAPDSSSAWHCSLNVQVHRTTRSRLERLSLPVGKAGKKATVRASSVPASVVRGLKVRRRGRSAQCSRADTAGGQLAGGRLGTCPAAASSRRHSVLRRVLRRQLLRRRAGGAGRWGAGWTSPAPASRS